MTLKSLVSSIASEMLRRLDEWLSRPPSQRHDSDDSDALRPDRDESFYWGLWLHRHW